MTALNKKMTAKLQTKPSSITSKKLESKDMNK
jgi:hypothetical protein